MIVPRSAKSRATLTYVGLHIYMHIRVRTQMTTHHRFTTTTDEKLPIFERSVDYDFISIVWSCRHIALQYHTDQQIAKIQKRLEIYTFHILLRQTPGLAVAL